MEKMSKEEFLKTYLRKVNLLASLEATPDSDIKEEDLLASLEDGSDEKIINYFESTSKQFLLIPDIVNYFESIYEQYLLMCEKGSVNEEELIDMFKDKMELLLNFDLDKALKSHYSDEELTNLIRANYGVSLWSEGNDINVKIDILKNIYKDFKKHVENKQVLGVFSGFDKFVSLYEMYGITDTHLVIILKDVSELDFNLINESIDYYYVKFYSQMEKESEEIQEKISLLTEEREEYRRVNFIIGNKDYYDGALSSIDELDVRLTQLEGQRAKKKEELENFIRELNGKKENKKGLLARLFEVSDRDSLDKADRENKDRRRKMENELYELEEQIKKVKKQRNELQANYNNFLASFDDAQQKLENDFKDYDKEKKDEEIKKLKERLKKIETYLSQFSKKDNHGKKIS